MVCHALDYQPKNAARMLTKNRAISIFSMVYKIMAHKKTWTKNKGSPYK